MTGRISCCIPGCRRSFKREESDLPETELICGRCWRMADIKLRERSKRARARLRKIDRLGMRKAILARGLERLNRAFDLAMRLEQKTWEAVKQDATIKAAFGIENAPRRKPRVETETEAGR